MAFTKPQPGKRLLTALIAAALFLTGGFYPVTKFLPSGHRLSQQLTFQNESVASPEIWNAFLNDQIETLQNQAPLLNNYLKIKSNDTLQQLTLHLR